MIRKVLCFASLLLMLCTGANATVGLTIGSGEPTMIPRGGRGNGITITFGDSGHAMTAPVVPSVILTPFGVVTL